MNLFLIGSALAALLLGGDTAPRLALHGGGPRACAADPARPGAARPERAAAVRGASPEAARAAPPRR